MKLRYPTTVFVLFLALWVKAIYPASSGIADTDFFWHLTYGEWIIQNGTLPATDVFSWTFRGQPYQLTQWLGEVAMGWAYLTAGLDGTKVLSVLLAAITIWFSWKASERYVHSSVALGLSLMCNLVQIVTPMRPQLFTFAFLALGMWLITGFLSSRRLRYLMPYPLLIALWVNTHGGFVVGLAMIGLMSAGVTLEAVLDGTLAVRKKPIGLVWGVVGASFVATLLNPYGYKALLTVLMIGGLRSSSVISEWMPVNLTTELGWFYLINLVPFVALMAVTGQRPRLTVGLLAGFFLLFGVLANRQVAMCAAVMAPLTASLLAQTPQYRRMLVTITNPSHTLAYGVMSCALCGAFPTIAGVGNATWSATMNLQYPILATDFLEKNGLTERVLSDTLESSYLIHRRVPVFIDGRMDLYRDRFFFEWYLASRAAPGWDVFVRANNPQAMLLRLDMGIRQAALAGGNWKQAYQDERYSVLVPVSSPLPSIRPSVPAYLDQNGRPLRPYMP